MKRTPLTRNTALRRGDSVLERKTPLAKVNRKRAKRRRARDFGSKADFVRALPCLVCGTKPSEPHHFPTRGAGGTSKDLTPLCTEHHREFHGTGAKTFQRRHGINLRIRAEEIQAAWEQAA